MNKLKIDLENTVVSLLPTELGTLEAEIGRDLKKSQKVLPLLASGQPVDSDLAWDVFREFLTAEIDYYDKFKKEIRAKYPNLNKAICLLVATFRENAVESEKKQK